jgi:hypothetical protein
MSYLEFEVLLGWLDRKSSDGRELKRPAGKPRANLPVPVMVRPDDGIGTMTAVGRLDTLMIADRRGTRMLTYGRWPRLIGTGVLDVAKLEAASPSVMVQLTGRADGRSDGVPVTFAVTEGEQGEDGYVLGGDWRLTEVVLDGEPIWPSCSLWPTTIHLDS